MRKKFRIDGVLVNDTGKCYECRSSLGIPERVIRDSGDRFTFYTCSDEECQGKWYRPHRDNLTRPE